MGDYLTIRCEGFKAYGDALVAEEPGWHSIAQSAYLLSLVGTPAQVQAISANILQGKTFTVIGDEDENREYQILGVVRSLTKRSGNLAHKVMRDASYLGMQDSFADPLKRGIVYGPDMETVKRRAFLLFDTQTHVPLAENWQDWLWENLFYPRRLHTFGGGEELSEAWLVTWPAENEIEDMVLAGITEGYLN